MTVSTNVNKVSYAGNGSTTAFDLGAGFIFFNASELEIYIKVDATGNETLKTITTDYTVSGGGGATGTVTMNVAPAVGETFIARRVMPLTQLTDLVNNDTQDAEVVEDMHDKAILGLQQLEETNDRTLKLPVSETPSAEVTLPPAVTRGGKILGFDSSSEALPIAVALTDGVEALNAGLSSINFSSISADKLPYYTGVASGAQTPLTAYMRTLLDDADALTARVTLDAQRRNALDSLVFLVHPTRAGAWANLYKGGWKTAFFNQQWGGPHWGSLPDGTDGDSATGYIKSDSFLAVGDAAARTYQSMGFKVGQAISVSEVWVYVRKIGDPSNNLSLTIYNDSGGNPGSAIGFATARSGRQFSADVQWEKFVIPTPPPLSANTQYHIVLNSSGAVDASNYWQWAYDSSNPYPHGEMRTGDGTPTWSDPGDFGANFLVIATAAGQFLQTNGTFENRFICAEGSPLNESRAIYRRLPDSFSETTASILIRGEDWSLDRTFLDIHAGSLDMNRIICRANASTGYPQLELYESDGTRHTVVGTTNLTDGSYHDVMIVWRAWNDGADVLRLYVDGLEEGTPVTTQSFSLDRTLTEYGAIHCGGGFDIPPPWTQTLDMTVLPSAASPAWAYAGGATEAAAFNASAGTLYQNGNGYASADAGQYQKTPAGLVNATGWVVVGTIQVSENDGALSSAACALQVQDGTKLINIYFQEFFVEAFASASLGVIQYDMTTRPVPFVLTGKGSDFFLYLDGRLAYDGTGQLTAATAGNSIIFGDLSTSAGQNATVQWGPLSYYSAGSTFPEFSSIKIDEIGGWSKDYSSQVFELYNSGSPLSAEALAGARTPYAEASEEREEIRGIVTDPTTTATAPTPLQDLEAFVLVSREVDAISEAAEFNSLAAGTNYLLTAIDSKYVNSDITSATASDPGFRMSMSASRRSNVRPGLHHVESRWYVSANTGTAVEKHRRLIIRTR